ncbi:TetR family transcriptional regulator [Rhodococcoides trifolii]|uniref:TetR family transcriptional regulator n=1 Tax=Rhodococcoides trifolii TaxID=908250 RepID=A0A917G3B7_9NOCA|nr:TetR family transcriptional regulator [Rhodococcus trifolii]GGG20414.1 TetR family transcriptional regulator [Rhodococcus trifolii]
MPAAPRSTAQSRYRTAAATLQRDTTLDAVRELLRERNWRSVTMNDVAAAAGLSRQTIYNEFGSRRGLAQGYAMRLTDSFVSVVDAALYQHVGDVGAALRQGFTTFFALSVVDPLVMSLHGPDAPDDLLRLITTDSDVLIERAGTHMSDTLQNCWVEAPKHKADIVSRAIVRLALSYVPRPPVDPEAAAGELSELLAPYLLG